MTTTTISIIIGLQIISLLLAYRWGHKDGHKEGWEEGFDDGISHDSKREYTEQEFVTLSASEIFASRIQGLFTGKIKRNAVAKEAVLDAQALWNRLEYERLKNSGWEDDEPTDDE